MRALRQEGHVYGTRDEMRALRQEGHVYRARDEMRALRQEGHVCITGLTSLTDMTLLTEGGLGFAWHL